MVDVLGPLFDDLLARVENLPEGEAKMFQLTNRGLKDPRWVKATLKGLRDLGFAFKFYTPQMEMKMGPSGFCRWFDVDPATGDHIPQKLLQMSSNVNSVDALRIAAHEMAHALTLKEADVLDWAKGAKTQGEFMQTPGYCWGEAVADSTAALVACVASPGDRDQIFRLSSQYIGSWPNAVVYMREDRDLILQTAATILAAVAHELY